MIARELITDDIPPLTVNDTGLRALAWMDEFKVSHLPLIDGSSYLGLIAETDILDMENPEKRFSEMKLDLEKLMVLDTVHIYEVMMLVSDRKISVVPVLDENERFLGVTHIQYLMDLVVNTASISEPGGIIILSMSERDYSMAQVSQIVESNDARILSSYITSSAESTELELTLKINRTDLAPIVQTFMRYDYTVRAIYHKSRYRDTIQDNFDSLMNFLKI